MSDPKQHSNALKHSAKALAINCLKTSGVLIAFIFRLLALILTKLSEIIEKLTGHGNAH